MIKRCHIHMVSRPCDAVNVKLMNQEHISTALTLESSGQLRNMN